MGCAGPGERVAERKTSFPKGQPLGLHLPLHCHSSYTYAVPSSLRNLVWSLVLRSQKTRIWELTPPVYRLRSSSISAAALIAWTSFPLQGWFALLGKPSVTLVQASLSLPSPFPVHSVTLFLNLLACLAWFLVDTSKGVDFGLSILWFVIFTPCAFLCWYRPVYKAFR